MGQSSCGSNDYPNLIYTIKNYQRTLKAVISIEKCPVRKRNAQKCLILWHDIKKIVL